MSRYPIFDIMVATTIGLGEGGGVHKISVTNDVGCHVENNVKRQITSTHWCQSISNISGDVYRTSLPYPHHRHCYSYIELFYNVVRLGLSEYGKWELGFVILQNGKEEK